MNDAIILGSHAQKGLCFSQTYMGTCTPLVLSVSDIEYAAIRSLALLISFTPTMALD